VCDDELAVSLEGIECIILQGQFYGNVGRPRKGWTIIRRALSHAVLLGLHKSSSQASTTSSMHTKRRENVWWHLVQCDAYLSLLVGLPSFMFPTLVDLEVKVITTTGVISNDHYRRTLALLVGRISQRNQEMPTSLTTLLSTTIPIDRELEVLASHLPPPCWNAVAPSRQNIKSALESHEDIITYFWHYQAKAYLHMPFMLQCPADNHFDYNRRACVTASREIVQVYIRMRELTGGSINLCRVVDFQAFTATVILILGLLGMRPTSAPQDISQDAEDWSLVYKTTEVLRKVASEPENLVAAQCFQALETLVSISNGELANEGNSLGRKIFIPYLGMIRLVPGRRYISVPSQGTASHVEASTSQSAARSEVLHPVIDIDVLNAPFYGNNIQNMDWIPPPAQPHEFPLPDALAMDIDQDWSWMLNSDYPLNWQEQ
jgi:Fungal specific transcription factor domain